MKKSDDGSLRLSKKRLGDQLICFFGTYPPRECGIATFTYDLSQAIKKRFNPKIDIAVTAINEDPTTIYNYPSRVLHCIAQNDIEDYIKLARRLNKDQNIKIINIQHEFGIFGGEYGNHIIPFLETIEKPVVVTFHSVLPDPDEYQKKVVKFILDKSSAVVVMARKAIDILEKEYGGDRKKIHYIPHGTPQIPFHDTQKEKEKLGFKNKIILSTFGLLNRGKGLEYVIKALPKVIEKYPNILYLIIGETHPVIREKEGERYRERLKKMVEDLGLKKNVKFYNKYLTLNEIIMYLKATDIYVSTSLNENQITSGTLAYAFAAGKPIISTRFLHAQEILADGAGILVDFEKPKEYEKALFALLDNPNLRENMAKRAYLLSRHTTWPNVAQQYVQLFEKITKLNKEEKKFPKITLKHIETLTDNNGIIQFANHSTPDINSGYTTDDNARALIVTTKHYSLFKSKKSLRLSETYLDFLEKMQKNNGDFFNYLNKDLEIMDKEKHQDSYGRALWACGYASLHLEGPLKEKAKNIFEKALMHLDKIESLRARAFSILGLYYYNKAFPSQANIEKIKTLADSIIEEYKENETEDWKWFETKLTYSNGLLPESLFLAYDATGNSEYLKVAQDSLNFLIKTTIINGKFVPIGHNGWFNKEGKRAFYDQQPIDVCAMVRACLTAYEILSNRDYLENAIISFNWFLGKNSLNQMMYDESTGGCNDGLCPDLINVNQGAESTISYLMARLILEEIKRENKL